MSADDPERDGDAFNQARPRLRGLAYRMLGTITDADDAVQDVWLRWQAADITTIKEPQAWLTTVTTRIALDRIRADRHRREAYIGPWLPEPIVSGVGPEEAAELADTLTLGFLTLLDELNPVERAVFVLAEVFAVPFHDIGPTGGKSEVACRQIASRARRRLRSTTPRARITEADRSVVDSLVAAVTTGDIDGILSRLAPDVTCVSDGGSTRRAARRPIFGAPRVARFMVNLATRYNGQISADPASVNGDAGIVISLGGTVDLVVGFEVNVGRVTAIRIIRNPDKLSRIGADIGPIR